VKISELIARLAEMLEEHGDAAVKRDDDGRYCRVTSVRFDSDEGVIVE
jgi:hypothetical protein